MLTSSVLVQVQVAPPHPCTHTAPLFGSCLPLPRLDLSKVQRAEVPWSPGMAGLGENLADDDDIWQSLKQAGAAAAAKPVCNAFELAIEVGAQSAQ